MEVLVWLGAIGAGISVLLLAALICPMHAAFEANERGFAGGGTWLGWNVRIDRQRREWELRFLRLLLVRLPMNSDDPVRNGEEVKPETSAKSNRPSYPLSAISTLRLARIAPRELRRIVGRLHVDRLRLHLVIATPDPALTGELYGYGWAAASSAGSWWPAASIDLGVDFTTDLPRGSVDAEVHARPIWLAFAALRIGWAYVRERRRSRRSR